MSASSESISPIFLNCEVVGNKLLGNAGHTLPVDKALGHATPQQLVATFSLQRSRFKPTAVHVGFLVDKVALTSNLVF